jgi:single-strand DNA-binding protein
MNNWTIAGRTGQDAELKYTQSGKAVASFSIAVDQGKDENGQKRQPLWIKATIWEKRAESLAPHIKKGAVVIVSGPARLETWTNREGESKAQLGITVREFTFGGGSGSKDDAGAPAERQAAPQNSGTITDDDIPF